MIIHLWIYLFAKDEEESDSDEEDDDEDDDEGGRGHFNKHFEDDRSLPNDYKESVVHAPGPRLDRVCMKALGIKKYVSFSTFISRFSPKILVTCPLADLRRTRLFGAFEKYSKMSVVQMC